MNLDAVLLDPGGSVGRPVTSLALTPAEARLVRVYFSFLMRSGLEPEYVCTRCLAGRRYEPQHKARVRTVFAIDDRQIAFTCTCRLIWFTGETPGYIHEVPTALPQAPTLPPQDRFQVPIPEAAAALFRAWKPWLRRYDLQEALHCTPCYEATPSRDDGCGAVVTDRTIRIWCRCTVRHAGA